MAEAGPNPASVIISVTVYVYLEVLWRTTSTHHQAGLPGPVLRVFRAPAPCPNFSDAATPLGSPLRPRCSIYHRCPSAAPPPPQPLSDPAALSGLEAEVSFVPWPKFGTPGRLAEGDKVAVHMATYFFLIMGPFNSSAHLDMPHLMALARLSGTA